MRKIYSFRKTTLHGFSSLLLIASLMAAPGVSAQYCTPTAGTKGNFGIGIAKVQMGTINNNTGTAGGSNIYTDFSAGMSTTLLNCQKQNFSITVGNSNTTKVGIFVDWNADNIFTSPAELVAASATGIQANQVFSGSFPIPAGQSPGSYRMRIVGDIGTITNINPCALSHSGDVEDYTLIIAAPAGTDIAVSSLVSPSVFATGINILTVRVQNLGSATINSATIGYNAGSGNVTQTITFPVPIPSCGFADVPLSTPLSISSAAAFSLKLWATAPNAVTADANPANDTITTAVCTPLSGAFTIDASGNGVTNFKNFTEAAAALNSCGVDGAVTITVAAGTYEEQVILKSIPGLSALNTLTIDGGTGNAASRIITYNNSGIGNRHTIMLENVSHITIKDITIRNQSQAYGYNLFFYGANNDISILNCNIDYTGGPGANSSTPYFIPVVFSSSLTNFGSAADFSNITFNGNKISGGYTGISAYGKGRGNSGCSFINNTISNAFLYGMFFNNMNGIICSGNTISMSSATSGNYGIYLSGVSATGTFKNEITGNKISATQYGLYVSSSTNSGTNGLIANNMIGGGFSSSSPYGIYFKSSSKWNIWFNSVNIDAMITVTPGPSAMYMSGGSQNDIRNNHFALTNTSLNNAGVFPLYIISGASVVNYNNYFKPGTSTNLIMVNGTLYSGTTFKGGGGHNANSVFMNPEYKSNLDLHTMNGCATGITLAAVTTDIDGETRTNPPAIGADENVSVDASASAIIAPSGTVVSGLQNVIFTARNTGRTPITSLTAGFSLNGAAAVTQPWTGTLNPCDSVTFTFSGGNGANFPTAGINRLSVFVRNPNGTADPNSSNDTTSRTYCKGPLAGVYTINPTAKTTNTFPSFASLIASLNSCGMNGNITVNVTRGVYHEQVLISSTITGLAGKTITFNGLDSSRTKITFYGGGYTLKLDGADNITFRNIAIENTGTDNANAVWLTNAADNNLFESCIISAPAVGNSTVIPFTIMGATYNASGNWGNNNILRKSIVSGGYATINAYGTSAAVKSSGNKFSDNIISGGMQFALNAYFQTGLDITGNKISGVQGSSSAVKVYYSEVVKIQRNSIMNIASSKAIELGFLGAGASRSIVENNMIAGFSGSGSVYGLYVLSSVNTDIFHNSVYLSSASAGNGSAAYIGGGSGNAVRNNIFANDIQNGYAYMSDSSGLIFFDYNNFYSSGASLARISGTSAANLSALKALNTSFNSNSVSVSPVFVNKSAASPDLHLMTTQTSPLADPSVSTTVDFDGDIRCTLAKTIGADESKFVNPVSVNFTTVDTAYTGSSFTATNAAAPGTLQTYQWDFNNDGTIDAGTPNAAFTFTTPGTKQIKLKGFNCNNSDSIVKTIIVVNPSGAPVANFSVNKSVFAPYETVSLTDMSSNTPTSWLWEITPVDSFMTANPGLTSKNPQLVFVTPGVYTVCLTSTNAAGSSVKVCKTAFITVKEVSTMCIFPFNSTAATGILYDEGGPTADYTTGKTCTYLIEPCALSVNLKFSLFTLGASAHYLRIYDGRDNTAPLLGTFTSAGGLPGGTSGITANSGSMYLEWSSVSPNQLVAAGYAAEWTIVPNLNPVVIPDFEMPDTAYELVNVDFINKSIGSGLSYSWDPDGDLFPDASTKNANFIFPSPGTYYPMLTVSDACGNVITKKDTIIIIVPPQAPVVDFKADILAVTTSDTVKFTDLSKFGPFSWTYTFNPAFTRIVGGTSQNPWVVFDSVRSYSVTLQASNNVGTGTLTKTNYINVVNVCVPQSGGGLVADLGINRVTLNEINNPSPSGTTAYTSYFSSVAPANLDAGGTYQISVFRNSALNKMSRKVWIDYNSDGDFNDAGELIGSESAALTTSWSHTFTVPLTAARGATRMRVGVAFNDSTNKPCGPNFYGEIEEYRVVISTDNTPPQITLKGKDTVTIEVGSSYTDSGATAFDAVDGVLTPVPTNNVNLLVAGTYRYMFNATDAAGNKAKEVVRIVIVSPDATAPILKLNAPLVITIPLFSTFTEPGYVATDAISGNVTSSVVIDRSGLDTTKTGTYLVKYTAYDAMNNTDVKYRTINVVDNVSPVIIVQGEDPMEVEVNTPFFDPGVKVYDNYDQQLTAVRTGNVDVNVVGSYKLTYSVTDASGNIATAERTVNVVDKTSPVLEVSGPDTIIVEVFGTFVGPLVTATDNYDPAPVITTTGTYNLSVLGDYMLSYMATDASGNTSLSDSVVIRVVDTQKPVIVLDGPFLLKIQKWQAFVEPGFHVEDNYYTNLEASVVKGGNFVHSIDTGLFFVTYNVTDPSGNVADEVIRMIQVIENTTSVKDISGEIALNVYPNPASHEVTVELANSQFLNGKISITNMLGKVVSSITPEDLSNSQNIDISNLASGIYLLHVVSDGEISIKRLVISK